MTRNFYYLTRKSFQNDEKWRLFYCDSIFGCRVMQAFCFMRIRWLVTSYCGHKMMSNHQKMEYLWRLYLYRTETLYSCCIHYNVSWHFHCDISMATQWAPGLLHSKDKIRFFSFKKCYLLLLFIQWVWFNMVITQHNHKEQQISMLLWWHHNYYQNVQFLQLIKPAKFQPCRLSICTDIPYFWYFTSFCVHNVTSQVI